METVVTRAPESTDFGLKSIKKMRKSRKKSVSFCLGRRCRRFEPCHSDHMKIIRTFSYLESRSDYLFYLSIPTLIARNENSRYYGLLTLVSALALLKNTHFYDIINTSKYFLKNLLTLPLTVMIYFACKIEIALFLSCKISMKGKRYV